MFKTLLIQNFRGIKDLEIKDLKRVNLLVGKNNCGKSSVLESLYLLSDPLNPKRLLESTLSRFGQQVPFSNETFFHSLFYEMDTAFPIQIRGDREQDQLNLKIEALPVEEAQQIDIEEFAKDYFSGKPEPTLGGLGFTAETNQGKWESRIKTNKGKIDIFSPEFISKTLQERGLKSVPQGDKALLAIIEKEKEEFEERISSTLVNSVYFGARNNPTDLLEKFHEFQIAKQKNQIIELLQRLDPSLSDLTLGNDDLIYSDTGLEKLIPFGVAGDGIKKFFSLILKFSEAQDGILLFDEVENGFYHSSQKVMWEKILDAAKEFNVQIFATTHSWDCVQAFTSVCAEKKIEEEVRLYRMKKRDEKIKIVMYEHDVLQSSLESNWEVR